MKTLRTITTLMFFLRIAGNSQGEMLNFSDQFTSEIRSKDGEFAVQTILALPSEEKSEALLQIANRLIQLTLEKRKFTVEDTHYTHAACGLFSRVGDDKQIISAFKNLENFGNCESNAATVLTSCEGPDGVEIVEKVATHRFLNFHIPSNADIALLNEDDRRNLNDTSISLLKLVIALQEASASIS